MKINIKKLSVSAMLIALSTVLSELIPSIPMPFGGSATLLSMVPVCLIGIMFGMFWGVGANLIYGAIQLLFGASNLSYATWWGATVAIVLFDYIIAYAVLGLSGIFKKVMKNKLLAAVLGVIFCMYTQIYLPFYYRYYRMEIYCRFLGCRLVFNNLQRYLYGARNNNYSHSGLLYT